MNCKKELKVRIDIDNRTDFKDSEILKGFQQTETMQVVQGEDTCVEVVNAILKGGEKSCAVTFENSYFEDDVLVIDVTVEM